ncbi:MAG: heterocyst frequency control protein PatD [Moorea sp. SIO2B7]|nr:heterocyst frequency control protein PatD [Moorena sp. SIO2B7]
MLPKLHSQAYQEFLSELLKLQNQASAVNLDFVSLDDSFQILQKIFQGKIISLTDDQLEPTISSKWKSIQTEIYRAFRLLQTDMMFLRSSRQAATMKKRLVSLDARLETLIGYCRLLLSNF